MDEEPNPVKDLLYEKIEKIGEDSIQIKISEKNYTDSINDLITICLPKVLEMEGDSDENVATLATSILHYLLTVSLTPSQRKLEKNGVELDIVIPDLRTLNNYPKNSLLICIPKQTDTKTLENKLEEIQKIQPINDNIWFVFHQSKNIPNKQFCITDKTFYKILDEINDFLSSTKQTQFKIFKSQ